MLIFYFNVVEYSYFSTLFDLFFLKTITFFIHIKCCTSIFLKAFYQKKNDIAFENQIISLGYFDFVKIYIYQD